MYRIGIIGGSGTENLFNQIEKIIHVETPFGISQPLCITKILEKEIVFTNRHSLPGSYKLEHVIPPHKINSRALIYGMAKSGVKAIIGINSVGSLHYNYKIGNFFLPTQFIDFTKGRNYTFYEAKYYGDEIIKESSKVKHVDMTNPFCEYLQTIIFDSANKLNYETYRGGCYVCTEGPRLETPAEIEFFRKIGCDVVGMTLIPEVILAREIGLHYVSICVITNYAAGMQERISLEEVKTVFKQIEEKLKNLLKETIVNIKEENFNCKCEIS